MIAIPPHVADRNLGIFAFATHDFRQLVPAFLGQRRQGDTQRLPGRGRVKTQVRFTDRTFHGRHRILVPWRNRKRTRVAHRDAGDLIERRRIAVIVDLDVIEQPRVSSTCPNFRQIGIQCLDRLGHPPFRIFLDCCNIVGHRFNLRAARACLHSHPILCARYCPVC